MRFLLAVALLATSISLPAAAHEPLPPNDEIVLQLSTEGWVDTKTARVVAVVQTVLSGEEAQKSDERVPSILRDLAPDTDWHVVRFDRSRDESGLERWRITAETRLPEEDLAGIYDRARSVSEPGQQVEIAAVDFTPTLEEREQTAAQLRSELYRKAQEEAERVAAAFPGAGYRITRIDFVFNAPPPQPYARETMMRPAPMAAMQDAQAKSSGSQGVSERMVLTATVTVGAPPPSTADENP